MKCGPLIGGVALLIVGFLAQQCGVIINVSPSMPEGIYIKSECDIQRGSIVAVCLPPAYQAIGLKQKYIEIGNTCHGAYPLIKQVIAVPGDNVALKNNVIVVNGKLFFYKTLAVDSTGRPLSNYPRGTYAHTDGYWLIGTAAKNSWDSRYWGPVRRTQILYPLRVVWV